MAHLTQEEFEQSLEVLQGDGTVGSLRDKFARLGAFHSRKNLNSLKAVGARVFRLSGGLRRDVPAARAFQALWAEYIGSNLTEESGEKLDELADKINECLNEDGSLKDGEKENLEGHLSTYEDLLARKVGGAAARLDTIQKAVDCVAEILRSRPILDVPRDPAEEHDHDHDHDHDH